MERITLITYSRRYLDRGGGVLARQKDFLNISENVGWYGFGPRKKTTLLNSGSTEMKE